MPEVEAMTETELDGLVSRLLAVTEDDAYATPWTFGRLCQRAARALSTLSRELAEARAAYVAAQNARNENLAAALAAESSSASKDERIRELEAALAVFAAGATVFYADEPDDCVLSLGRWKYQEDGRARFYADVQYTVADIRRARALTKEPT